VSLISFRSTSACMLLAGALSVTPAYAQSDDDWQYSGGLNLWAAGVQGTTQNGTELDVSFSDVLDGLDFAFLGTLEARNSRWTLLGDYLYLKVSDSSGASIPTPAGAVPVTTNLTVKSQVINLIAGYHLVNSSDGGLLDVVFGARNLDLTTQLSLGLGGVSGGTSISDDVWDGVVGIRGRANLQGNWFLPLYLDFGAGDSDLTWQAIVGAGYKYNWGDLTLAYRHIAWEFDDQTPIADINYSGPLLQGKWHF
jgi:hypothetical protein